LIGGLWCEFWCTDKVLDFLGGEEQQMGHAKIAKCNRSCRKVPGSRGTCLRFNGSPNAIICAGIIYGANSAASINAMIFQGAVHQLKGHSKFASSCPSWRRIPAAGPFVYDFTAAHKCSYLCRDNVWCELCCIHKCHDFPRGGTPTKRPFQIRQLLP
jgi:hypothetical protein